MIDLLTCVVQSTRIVMVDNAPLFRVFDEESNITQRTSELFGENFFFLIYFPDKGFEPPISRSVYEHFTTSLGLCLE